MWFLTSRKVDGKSTFFAGYKEMLLCEEIYEDGGVAYRIMTVTRLETKLC